MDGSWKSQGWLGEFILLELEQTDVWWRRRTRMSLETDVNLCDANLFWKSRCEMEEREERKLEQTAVWEGGQERWKQTRVCECSAVGKVGICCRGR